MKCIFECVSLRLLWCAPLWSNCRLPHSVPVPPTFLYFLELTSLCFTSCSDPQRILIYILIIFSTSFVE